MSYKSNILLGQITKTVGFEGAVAVKLEKAFVENIPEMESVFIEIDGRPVPFFIDHIEYQGADIIKLAFAGYTSAGKASEFRGCNVYLTGPYTGSRPENELHDLNGFSLEDQYGNVLGTVMEIVSLGGQLLLSVKTSSRKDLLVPLHEDLIIGINRRKKIISMEIPEGLTDLA